MQNQDEVGLSETQWRVLWEEQLDRATRRRITKGTRRGLALADPDEAAVAVEFARRRMSRVRLVAAISTIVYLGLLVAMVVLREGDVVWTYWLLFGIVLAAAVGSRHCTLAEQTTAGGQASEQRSGALIGRTA